MSNSLGQQKVYNMFRQANIPFVKPGIESHLPILEIIKSYNTGGSTIYTFSLSIKNKQMDIFKINEYKNKIIKLGNNMSRVLISQANSNSIAGAIITQGNENIEKQSEEKQSENPQKEEQPEGKKIIFDKNVSKQIGDNQSPNKQPEEKKEIDVGSIPSDNESEGSGSGDNKGKSSNEGKEEPIQEISTKKDQS